MKHIHKIALSDEEEFLAWAYAEHKHLKGQNIISSILAFAAFSYFLKYPIPEAKRERLVAEYVKTHPDAKAVQLFAILGKSEGSEKGAI